jgi:hypothetical protein
MGRRTNRLLLGLAVFSSAARTDSPALAGARSTAGSVTGDVAFEGSTILSMASEFQPGLLYKKFPPHEAVIPMQSWQLSVGALLASQAASIPATIRLNDPQQNPDIDIVVDSANFVLQNGLHNNFDPAQRFEIQYVGAMSPYIGPIDFVLAPDGFADIPLRVHLNLTEQPGFPLPFFPPTSAVAVVGNIAGDESLEIIIPGSFGSWDAQDALHAFDTAGNPLPGWPFFNTDPDVVFQGFRTPTIVDLDGDGHEEIVVIGVEDRDVPGGATAGTVFSTSLFVLDGSAQPRWQFIGALEDFAIPAVGDLDGDQELDVVAATETNLMRFESDGTVVLGWQVETLNDVHVMVPVIGDLDGDPADGKEIVACSPVFGSPPRSQVYVWDQDGSMHSGAWPKELPSCRAPAVLNLDGNPSNGREIVMAIDFFNDPPVDPVTGFLNTFTVFAWHGDGSDVDGWPHRFLRNPNVWVDDRIIGSTSAADLDGNGDIEIVVGTYGQGDPANGNLFVFHHDGTLDPNWPQWAGIAQTPSMWGGAALADLDGDALLEIITGSFHGVFAFRADGQPFEGFPRRTSDNFAQAVIADIDVDGRLEIIQPSLLGLLRAWKLTTSPADPRPWPLFRQNPRNTGSRDVDSAFAVPTVSQAGLVVTMLLLILAGFVILNRSRLGARNARSAGVR